jgi:hypothetical protein
LEDSLEVTTGGEEISLNVGLTLECFNGATVFVLAVDGSLGGENGGFACATIAGALSSSGHGWI